MSSSSGEVNLCRCGLELQTLTSWTDWNPGRQFKTCPNSRSEGGRYHSFFWIDPPMCERFKVVIPRLLARINRLRDENAGLRKNSKEKTVNWSAAIAWFLLILVIAMGIALFFR